MGLVSRFNTLSFVGLPTYIKIIVRPLATISILSLTGHSNKTKRKESKKLLNQIKNYLCYSKNYFQAGVMSRRQSSRITFKLEQSL